MNAEMFCMELVCDMRMVSFGDSNFQKVNIGKGVTGRVLESENKICFIENFGGLSILESPWAHYAQAARLEFCFVICLQSSLTGDYIYVLEFFISPGSIGDEYPWSYLRFLLHIMSIKLRSFKVASGRQLETNLIHQAIRFGNRSGHEVDPMANVEEQEQCNFFTNPNRRNKRNGSEMSLRISDVNLEPHLGKGLEDAANKLDVSGSTLKRTLKDRGMNRYPSNVKNKRNQSVSHTCIKSTREVYQTCQENDVVLIKAKYEHSFMKFFFFLSSGLEMLMEEVHRRRKLTMGNFELKYENDNGDLVSLTCDEDLHLYAKRMRSLGNITIRLLVHLVSDRAVSVEDS